MSHNLNFTKIEVPREYTESCTVGKVNLLLVFEDVLTKYEPMISACIRKLHIYKDHEHYRQIGRIALWQAWTRFDGKKGNFTPFAYRTIWGMLLDELKKENRLEQHVVPAEDDLLTHHIDTKGLENEEWGCGLDDVIQTLSHDERTLIQWLFIEACTQAECAKRAGISVAGIKKRRERLLKKLRKMLEEEMDSPKSIDDVN